MQIDNFFGLYFISTVGKLLLASRMQLSDVNFVAFVLNRNIAQKLELYFINMFLVFKIVFIYRCILERQNKYMVS